MDSCVFTQQSNSHKRSNSKTLCYSQKKKTHSLNMSSQTHRRLQKELLQIIKQESPPRGIFLFPKDPMDLFVWDALIEGPSNSVYADLKFKLEVSIPKDYPFKLPNVIFVTKTFHPNVDNVGNICLDILKENWSAVYNITQIMISLQVLLEHPNNESPLNVEAANLWHDKVKYQNKVKEWYNYEDEVKEDELFSSEDDFSDHSYI